MNQRIRFKIISTQNTILSTSHNIKLDYIQELGIQTLVSNPYTNINLYLLANLHTDPPCTESTIRLTGGQDKHEGRVEVCSNGVWGTICGGLWDYNDTTVVCRQLGYQNPSKN